MKLDFIIINMMLLAATAVAAPRGGAGGEQPRAAEPQSRARYLMGTVCAVTAYGERTAAAQEAAFAEIARLERILTVFDPDSEVSRLNRAAGASTLVSPELYEVLAASRRFFRETGGAFDPSFASPPAARGADRIELDAGARAARLPAGMRLDFGGIGKGYALDRAAAAMRAAGAAAGLLNFGGQVLAFGKPPGEKGKWILCVAGIPQGSSPWMGEEPTEAGVVSVPSPLCRDEERTRQMPVATEPVEVAPPCAGRGASTGPCPGLALELAEGSAAASGNREQGEHIVDPATGARIRRAGAVVAILPDATAADAWSTALFARGLAAAPPGFPGCAAELAPGAPPRFAGRCADFVDTHTLRRKP